jgi:hypothetical protein
MSHADLPPLVLWRNRQIEVRLVLRPKPRNRRCHFEDQITKPELPVLRLRPGNPSTLVLSLNQETRVPCLLVPSIDHTRPVPDHPRSSAPSLLLLPRLSLLPVVSHLSPTHHETSKHDSLHKTKIKVKPPKSPGFEFKPWQGNDSSQSNQGIDHLVSHACSIRIHQQRSLLA